MLRHKAPILCSLVLLVLLSSLALQGCGRKDGSGTLKSVSDADGLFHVKVPSDWSSKVDPGTMILYSRPDLPTSDRLEALSIAIFASSNVTSTPVPEALRYVVQARASARRWRSFQTEAVTSTKIGGRDASQMRLTGTDANGVDFSADYEMTRTSGYEVLVIAVAPRSQWDAAEPVVTTLLKDDWYWHLAPKSSTATSAP